MPGTPKKPASATNDPRRRPLLVYTSEVLPRSQTFVADQMRFLEDWEPSILGRSRTVDGIDVDRRLSPCTPEEPMSAVALARQRATRRVPALMDEIRRRPPALIHAHFLTAGFDVVKTIGNEHIPIVVTSHGFDATWAGRPPATFSPQQWLHGLLRHRLLRTRVHLIAVSEFIRDTLIARGADPGRISVHHTGVDTELFRPPRDAPRSGVLFVGRLVEQKGVHDLLIAAARLQQQGIDCPVRVIGDGPERQRAEASARRLRIRADFLGSQPREVVTEEMQRAAVLCSPSKATRDADRPGEGFGMVLAEAQASGMPVVATRSGGMTEAVGHERTGLLVDDADMEGLVAALTLLLTDEVRRSAMGRAARAWVLDRFNLRIQNGILEQIYAAVAGGQR